MRLKLYQAPNMGAAMAMVRDELGPDALILASRPVEDGIELTAGLEVPTAPPEAERFAADHGAASAPAASPPSAALPAAALPAAALPSATLPGAVLPRAVLNVLGAAPLLPTELVRAGSLRWHGVPPDLATRLARGELHDAIGSVFRFGDLPLRPGDPPLLLVGPPGAGKTLTTARLATALKLAGQPSLVITADGRRAGAAEQLAAFTRLLGLTLIVADTPQQLARAVARRNAGEPVLVDMPGLDPFDPPDREYLLECRAAIDAEAALVLPAGLDPADAEDLGTGFVNLGAQYLLATRLDQSHRLGGILAAAATGLVLTQAGTSAAVAGGLTTLTPDLLAKRLHQARRAKPTSPPLPPAAAHARSDGPRQAP